MNDNADMWTKIAKTLRDARAELPLPVTLHAHSAVPAGTLTGTLDEFEEFLEHNELELAWDALFAVGTRMDSGREFWLKLGAAASQMGLTEKAAMARTRASDG